MQGKPRKPGKKLTHGGNRYISIQQWADQSVGFSAADEYAAAGNQSLGEEGIDDPMG